MGLSTDRPHDHYPAGSDLALLSAKGQAERVGLPMKMKQRRLARRSVLFTGLAVCLGGGSVPAARALSGTFRDVLMTIGWPFRSRYQHVAMRMVPGGSKSASEVREAPAAPAGSLRWLPPRWRSFWLPPSPRRPQKFCRQGADWVAPAGFGSG